MANFQIYAAFSDAFGFKNLIKLFTENHEKYIFKSHFLQFSYNNKLFQNIRPL